MENNYLHLFSAFFAICIPLTCTDFINVNWLLRWQETTLHTENPFYIYIYNGSDRLGAVCIHHCPLLVEFWTVRSISNKMEQTGKNAVPFIQIWKLILNQPYSCLLCSFSHNLKTIYLFILVRCRAYEWANIFFFANAFKKATDKIPSAFVLAWCLTTKQKTASTC